MKEVKAEFKITSLGKIPGEWELVYLKDILSLIRNGLVTEQNKDGRGIPITRIETISEEKINPERVGYIENVSEKEISEYRLQRGDILFSHINSLDHIGKTALYFGDPPLLLHGMNLLLLRSQNSIVEPFYLYYQLKYLKAKDLFRNVSKKAVNQASINQTELGKIELALPPLPEQKKIAEILSAVDQGIEKVDEAIKKTQRLKKGLMQELLTKGIGHKEFKDTEIGRIPKEWEVVRLNDISLDLIGGGTPLTSNPVYWNGDIAWMTSAHIDGREIKNGQRYITKEGLKNSATNLLLKNNVLVATRVGIGKVAVNKIDIAISQDLTGVVINQKLAIPDFIYWNLVNNAKRLKALAQGSTIKGVLREDLGKMQLPLPSLPEQQQIAEMLGVVDERLKLLRKRKKRLEKIKKGLMNDLLTGKKRVRLEV